MDTQKPTKSIRFPRVKKSSTVFFLKTLLVLIGVHYYNGQSVPKDRSEAYRWWKKAAALGDEDAIKALKECGVSY